MTLNYDAVYRLAEAMLGEGCVREVRYGLPSAAIVRDGGDGPFWLLLEEDYARDASDADIAFSIAHELGEWLFYGSRSPHRVLEPACDAVGAAILSGDVRAVRRAARRALDACPEKLAAVVRWLGARSPRPAMSEAAA